MLSLMGHENNYSMISTEYREFYKIYFDYHKKNHGGGVSPPWVQHACRSKALAGLSI